MVIIKRIKKDKNGKILKIEELNENEDCIHSIISSGSKIEEEWFEYDDKRNLIYFKNSFGFEAVYEYDSNNRQISSSYFNEDNNEWHRYDTKNQYEYDEKGNIIYTKDSYGYQRWWEYNENGNCIHFKGSNGYEIWYTYDEAGRLIHDKNSHGDERFYEYQN